MKIADIMKKDLKVIDQNKTLSDAQQLMNKHMIRHLLVLDGVTNKLVGLISDRDLKKAISPYAGTPQAVERDNATLNAKVSDVMCKDFISIYSKADVKEAVDIMYSKKLGSLPVLDASGKVVGIITTIDLLNVMKAIV